jgi:hypothetical protein
MSPCGRAPEALRHPPQIGSSFVPNMTPTFTTSEDTPHWARPRLERQIDMLGELAEAGLVMALDIKDEAQALKQNGGGEPVVFEGLSRAFGRTARAVRLTLMLQERLIKGLIAFDAGGDVLEADASQDDVTRIVRIIIDPHADIEDRERLVREAVERLDHEDFEGAGPLNVPVATLRRDLGLEVDGPELAQEAWAREEISAGVAGWPLAVPPATTSSRDPYPLEGGRAGLGVNAPAMTQKAPEALSTPPLESFAEPPLHSPLSPALPPSRGKGAELRLDSTPQASAQYPP